MIRINVYNFSNRLEQYSLRISQVKFETHINLLQLTNEKTKHYFLRKSLSPLTDFPMKQKFIEHEVEYSVHTPNKARFNSGEDKIKCKNYDRQVLYQFVIKTDFENKLQSINTRELSPKESYVKQIQKHKPNSSAATRHVKEEYTLR